MNVDLDSMSIEELEKLARDIEKAIRKKRSQRKAEARKAAEEAARRFGFSLAELIGQEKAAGKPQARYRNPADPRQTWSGRGRMPRWMKEALAAGRRKEDFEIT